MNLSTNKYFLLEDNYRFLHNKIWEGYFEDVLNIMLNKNDYDAEGDNFHAMDIAEDLASVLVVENRKDLFVKIFNFLDKAKQSSHMFEQLTQVYVGERRWGKYEGIPAKAIPISWMEALINEVVELRNGINDQNLIRSTLEYINREIMDDELLIETTLKLFKFVSGHKMSHDATNILKMITPVFIANNRCDDGLKISNYYINNCNVDIDCRNQFENCK